MLLHLIYLLLQKKQPSVLNFGQNVSWKSGNHTCWSVRHCKRVTAPPPVFGPLLLWPNGWMDEDATSYGSRPRPRPHCVRRGPVKGAQLAPFLFSAHVCCGHGCPSELLLRSCLCLLWSPYGIGQTIIFSCCGSFYLLLLLFSSPNLSGRTLGVYHISTHDVTLVRI